jgi:hypothetical protein
MENFPFDQYIFLVLTVENPSDTIKKLLSKNGYKFVKALEPDELWCHTSLSY